jgi:precorrin-6A/cobalt-precorrin-6A reductase
MRASTMPLNVLILGGSSEASVLAASLRGDARFNAVLSLAGRTAQPASAPLPTRSGGFGGVARLADYLETHRVDALVVATHPFAARMRPGRRAAAADAAAGRRPSGLDAPGRRPLDRRA